MCVQAYVDVGRQLPSHVVLPLCPFAMESETAAVMLRAGAGVRQSAAWSCWRVLWMRTCLRRLGARGPRLRWTLSREMRSRACW